MEKEIQASTDFVCSSSHSVFTRVVSTAARVTGSGHSEQAMEFGPAA